MLLGLLLITADCRTPLTPRGSRRERYGLSLRPNLLEAIVIEVVRQPSNEDCLQQLLRMADFNFENPTFDPDGPGIDDDYSLDLPDAIMDPLPPRVQEELNTSGENIQTLRGEIREAELEVQKKRLVDTFYKEVNRAYGLRPDSIDYDQFRIDDDGKTLYWTPGDKKISISTTRGGVRFLALSTLSSRYGVGGTNALRRSLGLTGYTRKGLSSSAVKHSSRQIKASRATLITSNSRTSPA